jgi:hypothetical protein
MCNVCCILKIPKEKRSFGPLSISRLSVGDQNSDDRDKSSTPQTNGRNFELKFGEAISLETQQSSGF